MAAQEDAEVVRHRVQQQVQQDMGAPIRRHANRQLVGEVPDGDIRPLAEGQARQLLLAQ